MRDVGQILSRTEWVWRMQGSRNSVNRNCGVSTWIYERLKFQLPVFPKRKTSNHRRSVKLYCIG